MRYILPLVACLSLAACFEEDSVAQTRGTGHLVELALSGSAEALAAALEDAAPGEVAAIRYGPASNGLAHAAVGNRVNPRAISQVAAAGANVDLVDANGRTPLHFAIEFQSDAAVLALLSAGANPDIRTGLGQSPRAFCEDALKQLPDYAVCRTLLNNI